MAKVDLDKLLNDLGVSGAAPGAQSPGASRTQFSQPSTTPAQASPSGPAIGESSERPAIPPPPGPAFDLASILAPGGPIKRSDDDDQPEPDAEQIPAPPVEADASSEQFNESLPPQDPDHVGVDPQAALMHIYAPDANAGPVDDAADPGLQLVQAGVMTQEQLDAARLAVDTTPGLRLGDAIVAQGVDEAKAFEAVAKAAGLEFERLDLSHGPDAAFDTTQAQNLTTEFCKENLVLPLRTERGRLVMGVARPDDVFTHDDVRGRLGANSLKLVVCMPSELLAALAMLDMGQMEEVDVDEILDAVEEDDVQVQKQDQNEVDLGREAAESPVIRYVNYIIQQAIKEGASDIHIEPGDKGLKVRFRIDGVLFEAMHPPMKMAAAITSRLKIMANLDISERRVPQDGRIRCSVQGRKLDLRMSTLPTTYGEKTVMRILDTRSISVGLDDLGFDENSLTIWKHQLDQPHGIMLVTGPTGSGKTTTLYSSLRQMDKVTQNISTVEDPVEYHLDGITQTQTHEKIGMTVALSFAPRSSAIAGATVALQMATEPFAICSAAPFAPSSTSRVCCALTTSTTTTGALAPTSAGLEHALPPSRAKSFSTCGRTSYA